MLQHHTHKFIYLLSLLSALTFATHANSGTLTNKNGCTNLAKCSNIILNSKVSLSKLVWQNSYTKLWTLLKANTMYPEKIELLNSWEHKYDNNLNTQTEFENASHELVSSLNDQYTYFRDHLDTKEKLLEKQNTNIVESKLLENNLAYIHISSFSSYYTADETEVALKRFQPVPYLILDLRNNHGGYIEEALSVFSLLCDEGTFTSIRGRENSVDYEEIISVKKNGIHRLINGSSTIEPKRESLGGKKKILILVNNDTRSAAEMLAGALRDNKRAKIIGNKTFGKGVVQNTWNIEPACSVKIAMANYYLPSGMNLHGKGLEPDIELKLEKLDFTLSNQISKETKLTCLLPEFLKNFP